MKKFAKYIIALTLIVLMFVCLCAGLSACSKKGNAEVNGDTAESAVGKWDEYEGVKVAFADEVAYNGGDIDESKVLPEVSCKLGEKFYIIVDFDICATSDNDGSETVTSCVRVEQSALLAKLEETNSATFSEETRNGITEIKAVYKIPEKANVVQSKRIIMRFEAKNGGLVKIDLSFESSGDMQGVKTAKIEKLAVLGYTEELTFDGNTVTGISDKDIAEILIPSVYNRNLVTNIGGSAFVSCGKLTDIKMPNSVTSIGNNAFSGCSGLTSITIPDSVTSIGGSAFWRCSGLTNINIPNSVTSIGDSAFSGCSGLTNIAVGDENPNYKSEGNCLLSKDGNTLLLGIKTSIIPYSVIVIEESAFSGCSGLTSIIIPDSVTSIGRDAFYDCSKLTKIIIPNSVTTIGEMAFWGCENLTVYCRAQQKPSEWHSRWNRKNDKLTYIHNLVKVVWDYQGD